MRHPTKTTLAADIYAFGRLSLFEESEEAIKKGRKSGHIFGAFDEAGDRQYKIAGVREALDEGLVAVRGGELGLTTEGKNWFKRVLEETPETSRLQPEVRKAL